MNKKLIDTLLNTKGQSVDINQSIDIGSKRTVLSESEDDLVNTADPLTLNSYDFVINEDGEYGLAIHDENIDY